VIAASRSSGRGIIPQAKIRTIKMTFIIVLGKSAMSVWYCYTLHVKLFSFPLHRLTSNRLSVGFPSPTPNSYSRFTLFLFLFSACLCVFSMSCLFVCLSLYLRRYECLRLM
jgi:hypothetical protein